MRHNICGPLTLLKSQLLEKNMPEILRLLKDQFKTPIGEMVIVVDHNGNLRVADWADHSNRMLNLLKRHYGKDGFTLEAAQNPGGLTETMKSYFAGKLSSIDAVPTQTAGTPFQHEVWRSLREIPCGHTISYGELAKRIGRPKAVRAVGLANGSNPIGVVVPCHRVIGSDGSLTGYGGGIERKRWLLQHECKAARTS
jgi:methylated-DNA-[protein]-cysteine S-methyltransferase